MAISIDLPPDIERDLRQQVANLDETAKETLLVELYRQKKLTYRQISEALGLSRYDTDGVLKRHGAYDDVSLDEVLRDADHSRQARTG